jgi:nicotinate phosphoribosyltransferase
MGADAITLADETNPEVMYHPLYPLKSLNILKYNKEPLLNKLMENGVRLNDSQPLAQIAEYCRQRLDKLPEEFKRFDNPHIYKIGISSKLQSERDRLISELKNHFR